MSDTKTFDAKISTLGDSIANLTIKEAVELTDYMKVTYGIEPAAGAVMAAAGAAAPASRVLARARSTSSRLCARQPASDSPRPRPSSTALRRLSRKTSARRMRPSSSTPSRLRAPTPSRSKTDLVRMWVPGIQVPGTRSPLQSSRRVFSQARRMVIVGGWDRVYTRDLLSGLGFRLLNHLITL